MMTMTLDDLNSSNHWNSHSIVPYSMPMKLEHGPIADIEGFGGKMPVYERDDLIMLQNLAQIYEENPRVRPQDRDDRLGGNT